MAFSIAPVTGFPPPTAESFPQYIQFQNQGTDLGAPDATTLNFAGKALATRGVGENEGTVTVTVGAFAWNDQDGDYTLVLGDAENGVAVNATTGLPTLTVPGEDEVDFPVGTSILIAQDGVAQVSIVPVSGVTLRVREPFLALTAAQYAIVSLIKRGADEWYLAGDMGV